MFANLGLRVRFRMVAKVKAHTPVVLVLTVGKAFEIRTHAAATDGIKSRLLAIIRVVVALAVGLTMVWIRPHDGY